MGTDTRASRQASRISRAVWILPSILPAVLVFALVRLPTFGWESLLILGGTALILPVLVLSALNHRL